MHYLCPKNQIERDMTKRKNSTDETDAKRRVVHEITPLNGKEILYIADRHKSEFTYPIHNHDAYELNFVEHAAGVRRIVGDSCEVIGEYDLVLVANPELEHVWEQHECKSKDIREITVQFDIDFNDGKMFAATPFMSIKRMMEKANMGLCFPLEAIMKVYQQLDTLTTVTDGFHAIIQFLSILYDLSQCEGTRVLASSSYIKTEVQDDSSVVLRVKEFINNNYRDDIRLDDLASVACMSKSSFCRFFKLHTGKTVSEFILDIRLGHAIRLLLNTNKAISSICNECGFNNVSNFNRVFKKKKGMAPSQFRDSFKKKWVKV